MQLFNEVCGCAQEGQAGSGLSTCFYCTMFLGGFQGLIYFRPFGPYWDCTGGSIRHSPDSTARPLTLITTLYAPGSSADSSA